MKLFTWIARRAPAPKSAKRINSEFYKLCFNSFPYYKLLKLFQIQSADDKLSIALVTELDYEIVEKTSGNRERTVFPRKVEVFVLKENFLLFARVKNLKEQTCPSTWVP